jgi:hypothetical protein
MKEVKFLTLSLLILLSAAMLANYKMGMAMAVIYLITMLAKQHIHYGKSLIKNCFELIIKKSQKYGR